MPTELAQTESRPRRLLELAGLFLKLGTLGFGGPAAHIAMMQDEVVERRKWLDQQQFLDLVGATNLIPGPNSTEMAVHIGLRRAGVPGLLVAGACFILPAAAIVTVLAWVYVAQGRMGALEEAQRALFGVKPAILALILAAVLKLGRTAVRDHRMFMLAVMAATATAMGFNELAILACGALLGTSWLRMARLRSPTGGGGSRLPALLLAGGVAGWCARTALALGGAITSAPAHLVEGPLYVARAAWWEVGWFFLKVGTVIYGGGYVLIAFLEGGLVRDHGWLSPQQLLDAVSVGQVTPGPVFTTATFAGFLVTAEPGRPITGLAGAAAGTVGIFLPSFLFVLVLSRFLPRLRQWPWTAAFLDAVNVTAVGLMAGVWVVLARQILLIERTRTTEVAWVPLFIAIAAFGAVWFGKLNSALLVLAAAAAGWFLWPLRWEVLPVPLW